MKKSGRGKLPIDKLRDGPGSFDLTTPDDDSKVSEIISVGDRLLIVKGKGVYEIRLADQVDPERTNINAPNTIQRILPYGSEHSWIGAVVLTAHGLIKSNHLPSKIDCERALVLVLDMAQDIAGMHDLMEQYVQAQEAAIGSLDSTIRKDRSLLMPALGNVPARCKEFLQLSDHASRGLFQVVKLFYFDVGSGGWESLKSKIDNEPKNIDNFSQFLDGAIPMLQLIRNARNCVEHPIEEKRIEVADFSVDAENLLLPPMIEILHPKTPIDRMPVADFMAQVSKSLVEIAELMLVFLCARHVQSFGAWPIQVGWFPPERRKSPDVRYGYGLASGNQFIPIS